MKATKERWKIFPLDARYEISTEGKIRTISTGRVWKLPVKSTGYLGFAFGIWRNNKKVSGKSMDAHVAVALTWLGPRPGNYVVSHLNHDKTDNRISNLVYEPHSVNMKRHKGVAGRRKLKVADVLDIRNSEERVIDLMKKYDVLRQTIWKIRKRIIWKHI